MQEENACLDDAIQSDDLDFLYRFKKFTPSIDQPGQGTCVLAASGKWTWDSNLLSRVNSAYEPLELPKLVKLNDSQVPIIVAMHSHASVEGDLAPQHFNEILNKAQSDESNMLLDANEVILHQLSGLCEWSKITAAKFVAGDNMTL